MITGYERRRKLQSRREFELDAEGGAKIRFRTPDEIEFLTIIGGIPAGEANSVMRQAAALVPPCVCGWSGIKERDIDEEGSDDLLPFDQEDVPAVLDRYSKSIIPAFLELTKRYEERKRRTAVEVKN